MSPSKRIILLFFVFAVVFTTGAAETNKTEKSVNLGATVTSGNSKTFQANAGLSVERKTEFYQTKGSAEANFGESKNSAGDKETTINNSKISVFGKRTVSNRIFMYLDSSFFHDDIASVKYRVIAGPGLGYLFMKNDNTSISAELGPSFVGEKVKYDRDEYLAIRIVEKFEHSFNKSAKVWQNVEYLPKGEDFNDYLINSEIGVEAAMTETANIRIVIQDKYDNTPAESIENNDLTLISGINVKF